MYCPHCQYEYEEGITECPNCHVALIENLPVKEKRTSYSNLKWAAVLVIIGSCYFFVSRTIGTFFPMIFRMPAIGITSLFLSFLASLTPVLFFWFFYREFVTKSQSKLQVASLLAFISCLTVSFVHLRGLLPVISNHPLPQFLQMRSYLTMEISVLWICSLLILFFLIVVFEAAKDKGDKLLRKAASLAATGALFMLIIRSITLVNYFSGWQIRWLTDYPRTSAFIFLPFILFSFITGIYFYWTIYRELPYPYTNSLRSPNHVEETEL